MRQGDAAGHLRSSGSPELHRGAALASRAGPSHHAPGDDRRNEPPLVGLARDVWAGRRAYEEFHAEFAASIVYAQRPPRPGVLVTDIGERGRWTVVFSRHERLAAHAGQCDYLATTGADFLELVPEGVGVILDPDDQHRFPLLTRVARASQVAAAWARLTQQRGQAATDGVAEASQNGR